MGTKDLLNNHISSEYERVMKLIDGSYLFGEKVDIYNLKELVVAAYYAGTFDRYRLYITNK